jgi:hypothetical protein
MMSLLFSDPARWAALNVGGARMRDKRRTDRAVKIAQAMAEHPGLSIPQLFAKWSDCKAAYEFFDREEATPDRIQAGHRELVLERCGQPGVVLMLEDSTTMSYTGREPIAGLGPVGNETTLGQQGFIVHSVLAARWRRPPGEPATWAGREPLEVIGLADQQYRVRPPGTRKERGGGKKAVRREGGQDLESRLWEDSSGRIGPAPTSAATRWVRVCDREADIYEVILGFQQKGHGFVVRARADRTVIDAGTGEKRGLLFDLARQAPSLGWFDLELRERPGRSARTARLNVSAVAVQTRSPERPEHCRGTLAPLSFTVARVWEPDPPGGVEALEWVLLTDAVATSFGEALETGLQYSGRWLIEEYHKGMKTGMGAERLQLETVGRLMAAVALMALVALRLLHLKEESRLNAAAPACESGFTREELTVLEAATNRTLKTVGQVALALGNLGGHLNRKGDGMPGWLTLWRGWNKLQGLLEGWRLAKKIQQWGE